MKTMLLMKRARIHSVSSNRQKQGETVKSGSSQMRKSDNCRTSSQNLFEKYTNLAREALTTGDRVLAESYYQQAEHHLRVARDNRENIQILPAVRATHPVQKTTVKNNDFENSIDAELALAQANFC